MNKENIISELESNEEFQEKTNKIDEEQKNLEEARKELQDELDRRETEPDKVEEESKPSEPELQQTENFGTRRDLGKPATWTKILVYVLLVLAVIVFGSLLIDMTLPKENVVEVPIETIRLEEGSKGSAGEMLGSSIAQSFDGGSKAKINDPLGFFGEHASWEAAHAGER